ncbi:uncharacterized protein LOC120205195 [Hibiscus syriacus]|uniref:uncharacterized protein LOC120205195 n=1 Tax=Hibiscus syriacus TaxID=106335 RepID=UPI0019233D55|nr:uncharacterized protein LOC120205195 [Hibiscus syriacus]
MMKKINNSMGATNEAVSSASQKKQLRSRKPKFEVGKPKQGFDIKEKKDKKKKRKETSATKIEKLLEKFPMMFSEIRASNQRLRELIAEIDAHIVDQLNAWDDGGNGF